MIPKICFLNPMSFPVPLHSIARPTITHRSLIPLTIDVSTTQSTVFLPAFRLPHFHPRLQRHVVCCAGAGSGSTSETITGTRAIEVERKFELTPLVKLKVMSLPGDMTTSQFSDVYYDSSLALQDVWLRTRNGVWECKLPVYVDETSSQTNRSTTGAAAVYTEVSGADAILQALASYNVKQLPKQTDDSKVYASLHTHRMELVLFWEEYEVSVILDEVTADGSFHCDIGEFEIIVSKETKVEQASETILKIMAFLDIKPVDEKEGKLIKYIKTHRPELFAQLYDAATKR